MDEQHRQGPEHAADRKAEDLAAADRRRRRRLFRNRTYATGLVAGMGVVYFATHAVDEPGFAVRFVRSASEGGLVGGLADWFAITALFRRPLGLPIPHTAIISRSKERIGNALGQFVEENFLTEDILVQRLRTARIAHRAVGWLAAPKAADEAAGWLARSAPILLRALDSEELHAFAQRTLGEQILRADVGPTLGRLVDAVANTGEADRLFDKAIAVAEDWLETQQDEIFRVVREGSRWWVPKAFDRRIAGAIVDGLKEVLQTLREPDSDARGDFRLAIHGMVDELMRSPERRAQVDALKRRLLAHPDVQAWLGSIREGAFEAALEALEGPSPRFRAATRRLIRSLAQTLAEDEAVMQRIEGAVEHLALAVAARRHDIGAVMADIVRSWDERTIADRLEVAVGSDLQYIRMSGTLVGASVGGALFLLVHFAL